MSFKAAAISAVVCVLFAVGGTAPLKLLGISIDAFKIGGG
jgi:small neutral amino acid transporter SnatA (MarC family)